MTIPFTQIVTIKKQSNRLYDIGAYTVKNDNSRGDRMYFSYSKNLFGAYMNVYKYMAIKCQASFWGKSFIAFLCGRQYLWHLFKNLITGAVK